MNGTESVPVRPFLDPGSKGGEDHAEQTSSHDSFDRLVGGCRTGGGTNGAELCFAEFSSEKVSADVAEGDAEPGPEDKVGAGRDGEVDGLGEKGGEFGSEAFEEGFY